MATNAGQVLKELRKLTTVMVDQRSVRMVLAVGGPTVSTELKVLVYYNVLSGRWANSVYRIKGT